MKHKESSYFDAHPIDKSKPVTLTFMSEKDYWRKIHTPNSKEVAVLKPVVYVLLVFHVYICLFIIWGGQLEVSVLNL